MEEEESAVEMPTTTTTTSASDADANVSLIHDEERNNNTDDTYEDIQVPSTCALPWVVQILFALNGLVIALFVLPLAYIVNTRVQIPVAYVSTYGAFVFLPYSFKPLYAYLCSSKTLPVPKWCSGGRGYVNLPERHETYIGILIINSVCIFAYAMVPPGGVALLFIVGFLRGVTDAWAILCLGLILIDIARVEGHEFHQQHPTVDSTLAYDKIVSRFQSQAATLRNVGSVIGGSITFLVFLQRYLTISSDDNNSTEQLSGVVANGLLFLICAMQVMGAGLAFACRDFLAETESKVSNIENFTVLQQHDAEGGESDGTHGNATATTNEEDGLIDGDRSQSSYSSTDSEEEENFDDEPLNISADEARAQRRATIIVLVIMQIAIVLFVLKDPISSVDVNFCLESNSGDSLQYFCPWQP